MNAAASTAREPIRLYRHPLSGHCHRVEMFLSMLGLPFELVDVDFVGGEHKKAPFLARNPFGQVPVIEDGDVTLADSNAILVYLARRYDPSGSWAPADALGAARMQRWLSVAAGELVVGPGTARIDVLFGRPRDARHAAAAQHLFGLMEQHLDGGDAYLAGGVPTLADLAMYWYTAHAPEGGVTLSDYPQLQAWLARVEALPGFVGMQRSPLPTALAAA